MKPIQITYDICRCYLRDQKGTIASSLYNRILGKLRSRDFIELASCSDWLPLELSWGKEEARVLYQVEAFFKKNTSFTDPEVARLAALITFEEGERLCEETNDRLDAFDPDSSDWSLEVARAQRYIDRVLGGFSEFLGELPKLLTVTSGATVTKSRRNALPFLKVSKRFTCTPGAAGPLAVIADLFGYGSISPRLVSANRVEFVPKSWKTERTIACEAEGNMMLQLAFDRYAKSRLRSRGINLYDQTKNREMARESSIAGWTHVHSTVDLSMASDTLSYNTVALLLPEKWFTYLRSIRSQYGSLYRHQLTNYAKFSSMGNGATFALETLVFSAACSAVGSRSFSVYGDDIVIEEEKTERLLQFLAFLGFVPNHAKTFTTGPIRESCGTLWYDGSLITPRYIRKIDKRKAPLCHLVNTMVEIGRPGGYLWDYLAAFCSKENLPLVPYNEDSMSGVWITPYDAHQRKLIRSTRFGQLWQPMFRAFQPKTRIIRNWDSRSLFLWHLNAPREKAWTIRVRMTGSTRVFEFTDAYESSRYTSSSHKYVRKWVHWTPVVGAADYLYWWSELLSRESC